MASETLSRRAASLSLADELLADVELSRLSPWRPCTESKLAEAVLLDDTPAMQWLSFEAGGYPIEAGNTLGAEAWAAAERSHQLSTATMDRGVRQQPRSANFKRTSMRRRRRCLLPSISRCR